MLPKKKHLKKARISASKEIYGTLVFLGKRLRPILLLVVIFIGIEILNSNLYISVKIREFCLNQVAAFYKTITLPIKWGEALSANINYAIDAQKLVPTLLDENIHLKEKLKSYEGLKAQNQELKALLNLKEGSLFYPVPARVVSENFDGIEARLLIDIGASDGIKEGMAVDNQYGLVGRVIEVTENSARVMALQDGMSSIPAIIKPIDQRCIISGKGGRYLEVKYNDSEELKPGMEIFTSGDGRVLPKDIPVGKLSAEGSFAVANVDINKLNNVLVLRLITK